MFTRIANAPPNVLAIRAMGRITDDDYRSMLVPAIEQQIRTVGKIRLVYVIGAEFEGFDMMAAMDDALLGIHHWKDFEKVAVATDRDWIANGVRMMGPLLPAKTRIFDVAQMQDALDWAAA